MILFDHYTLKRAKKRLILLKYLYENINCKYPILEDSDNEEKETVFNILLDLYNRLEKNINNYENKLISYDEFSDICEKYDYEYERTYDDYPVISAFTSIARLQNIMCMTTCPPK